MKIAKYFWDFNDSALKETEKILRDSSHPQFSARMIRLLSRCQDPKELFSLVDKKDFVETWPKIRLKWAKQNISLDFKDWWDAVYESLVRKEGIGTPKVKGKSSELFSIIGQQVKEARLKMGLSQSVLAFKAGMKQPDISMIEEGKKNITLETLFCLCKILDIKKIVSVPN